jgi:hypothetical protein
VEVEQGLQRGERVIVSSYEAFQKYNRIEVGAPERKP